MKTSTSRGEFDRPRPQLYISPNRGVHLDGFFGRLAAWLELDSHENVLLTRRAATAMKFVAMLLLINFVFDLAAWWLLLNSMFSGGVLGFSLTKAACWAALGGALLLSLAILVYEQQFMTTDTSASRARWIPAVALRLTVVFGAAIVTSQAVELIFFKGPIENRVHVESAYKEAITRMRAFEAAQKMQTRSEFETTLEFANLKEQKDRLEGAQTRMSQAESRLRATRASASNARARASAIRSQMRGASGLRYRSLQRQLAAANATAARYEDQARAYDQDVQAARSRVDNLQKELPNYQAPLTALVSKARDEQKRVEDWIALVRNARPGEVIREPGVEAAAWSFQDQQYDFFQQLRVLNDLRMGKAARWPADASDEDVESLAANFKFHGLSQGEQQAEQGDRLIDAQFYRQAYWAVFVIALVIPMLMLAFKLLQPQELRDYYSSDRQMEAGNYGAVRFIVKSPRLRESGD